MTQALTEVTPTKPSLEPCTVLELRSSQSLAEPWLTPASSNISTALAPAVGTTAQPSWCHLSPASPWGHRACRCTLEHPTAPELCMPEAFPRAALHPRPWGCQEPPRSRGGMSPLQPAVTPQAIGLL